jgi:DNA-binding XRE family transcriptional regulator
MDLRSALLFRAGRMTSHQYRNALDRLELTQESAAQFLGVSIRTSHTYANGGAIPESVAIALKLMIRFKLKPEDIR